MVREFPVRLNVEGGDRVEIIGLRGVHHTVGEESTGKSEAYPSLRNGSGGGKSRKESAATRCGIQNVFVVEGLGQTRNEEQWSNPPMGPLLSLASIWQEVGPFVPDAVKRW